MESSGSRTAWLRNRPHVARAAALTSIIPLPGRFMTFLARYDVALCTLEAQHAATAARALVQT